MLLRIHCNNCGGTWDVYSRDNWKNDTARQCPHCFESVPPYTWQAEVIPAFASMMDANRELHKVHTGYGKTLFTVDFIADVPPKPVNDDAMSFDLDSLFSN